MDDLIRKMESLDSIFGSAIIFEGRSSSVVVNQEEVPKTAVGDLLGFGLKPLELDGQQSRFNIHSAALGHNESVVADNGSGYANLPRPVVKMLLVCLGPMIWF